MFYTKEEKALLAKALDKVELMKCMDRAIAIIYKSHDEELEEQGREMYEVIKAELMNRMMR